MLVLAEAMEMEKAWGKVKELEKAMEMEKESAKE